MTAAIETDEQRGMLCIDITGVTSVADGGVGAVLNPEGVRLAIIRTYIYFATGSVAAGNMDVGIAATAATKGTDILSGFDGVEATVGGKMFFGVQVPVNEAEQTVIWEVGEYLTVSDSGSSVGMAAKLFVEYLRLT